MHNVGFDQSFEFKNEVRSHTQIKEMSEINKIQEHHLQIN